MVFTLAGAACFAAAACSWAPWWVGWIAGAVMIQLRLVCYLMDGMVAPEGGRTRHHFVFQGIRFPACRQSTGYGLMSVSRCHGRTHFLLTSPVSQASGLKRTEP